MSTTEAYEKAYKTLNTAQKKAVQAITGPVIVVAGPGTGKTQVLTLRIAYILKETDTAPSSILCLTFTRSGVSAMERRLETYIGGETARKVTITTFHSFAIGLIEKQYELLDFPMVPTLLDDTEAVVLVDELLQNGEWEYLRPRTDPTKYFHDLKSLISILKRDRMSPEDFLAEVTHEIKRIEDDPESISTRGPSKGQLKKEIEKRIESLNRSREVVLFYEQYEKLKHERGFMDYDDVLAYVVELAEEYEDVRADIRENYQYVLVDEHQDSSGVQNAFLKAVWKDVERPDIFVVGDDRQLIYGFSGANLNYFTEFKTLFGAAEMITLTENYRSTAPILALAEDLLKSSVTDEALHSNQPGSDAVMLAEFNYTRDEIIGAGVHFKKLIEQGTAPHEIALLVPKNRHARSAVATLRAMGLPVVSEQSISLLELPATQSLMRILGIIADPYNSVLLGEALLDKTCHVAPFEAHTFLKGIKKTDALSISDMIESSKEDGLFSSQNAIANFGKRLQTWIDTLYHERVSHIVSVIGNELLIDHATDHDELLHAIEIVRSFIHASTAWEEKHRTGNMSDFIAYFTRLNTYGNHVEVARLGESDGIHVMTLHKSKGLEYNHVWIAHMNEEILMSEKHGAFTLPETVKAKIAERDVLTARRELYVAITRAKKWCTVSYAAKRDDGVELELAHIIADISETHFAKSSAAENETALITHDPHIYASKPRGLEETELLPQIQDFVRERFAETKISVSMLNNFFECTWKWYFRNFLRLPETKGVSLALGSAVHSTIEYILKSPKLPSAQELKDEIKKELEHEGVYDAKELARLGKDGYEAVTHWIDGYYKNLASDRKSERSVGYRDKQFPNLSMYGKIDLTERFPDGTITVTDFKTGTSKTSGVIEKRDEEGRLSSYMRQLAMYSYLIRGAEGNDVTQSRLLFLEEDPANKNVLYTTHVGDEAIDLLIRDIADYQNLLTSGEWVDRPCTAQSYGSGGECEYCKRKEEILGFSKV